MIQTHNYDLYPQGEYDAPWEDDDIEEELECLQTWDDFLSEEDEK